jgi:hypothetical protein
MQLSLHSVLYARWGTVVIDWSEGRSDTERQCNTNACAEPIKENKAPVVLEVNGQAELVLPDTESYPWMVERLQRADPLGAIRRGLDQFD